MRARRDPWLAAFAGRSALVAVLWLVCQATSVDDGLLAALGLTGLITSEALEATTAVVILLALACRPYAIATQPVGHHLVLMQSASAPRPTATIPATTRTNRVSNDEIGQLRSGIEAAYATLMGGDGGPPSAPWVHHHLLEFLARAMADRSQVFGEEARRYAVDFEEARGWYEDHYGSDPWPELRAQAIDLLQRLDAELPDSPTPSMCPYPPDEDYAVRIKRIRDRLGQTQGIFARDLGVSDKAVSAWENRARRPTVRHAQALVRLHGGHLTDYL